MDEQRVEAVPAAGQQRGRPFPKGVSGNPAGRVKGSVNKATALARTLMSENLPAIVSTLTAQALAGDVAACRLIIERLVPVAREIPITLPKGLKLSDAESLPDAVNIVLDAVEKEQLTLYEARELVRLAALKFDTGQAPIQMSMEAHLNTALSPKTMDMLNTILSRGQDQKTIASESPVVALESGTGTLT